MITFLKRLFLCDLLMHLMGSPFSIVQVFDPAFRKLRCSLCGTYIAVRDREQVACKWTPEIEAWTCEQYDLPRTNL